MFWFWVGLRLAVANQAREAAALKTNRRRTARAVIAS